MTHKNCIYGGRSRIAWLGVWFWLCLGLRVHGGVTSLDFSTAPPGTLAPGFYPGLTLLSVPPGAPPAVGAVAGSPCLQLSASLYIVFSTPQQRVKLVAGTGTGYATSPITLTAFAGTDPSATPLAVTNTVLAAAALTTPLEVRRLLSADIRMIRVDTTAANLGLLEYESGNPLGTHTLVTFEGPGLADGEVLSTQFPGVTFDTTNPDNAASIRTYYDTASAPYVAETTTGEVGNPGFLSLNLHPAQGAVRVCVGNRTFLPMTATLRAYTTISLAPFPSFFSLVGSASVSFTGLSGITNILEVDTYPLTNITHVEVEYSGDQWELVDNLEFAPNNPSPALVATPPVVDWFTVNGSGGPVVLWRPGGDPALATNVDVAGRVSATAPLRSVVVFVRNVTTGVTTYSNTFAATGIDFSFDLGTTVPITAGENLLWAVAVDTGGYQSLVNPVVEVVSAFPATAVSGVTPLSGNQGLVIREAGSYPPPDEWPIVVPPTGQTLTVTGTNLHPQMVLDIASPALLYGGTTVAPLTVAPDGSSLTFQLPIEFFLGIFPPGAGFDMSLVDQWPGNAHFLPGSYHYTVNALPPLPLPMLQGFGFPNRGDGASFDDFAAAIDGDSYISLVVASVPNPLDLIFFPIYIGVFDLGEPGSCFGMAASTQMYYNYDGPFYSQNFSPPLPDVPAGVDYPVGIAGGPAIGAHFDDHSDGPATPANLWAAVRANHGIQFSGEVVDYFLAQTFHQNPVAKLAEVAAHPHGFLLSMLSGLGNGHVVAPYAVVGNRIYVADSNIPFDWSPAGLAGPQNATNAYVEIDPVANTYSYAPQGLTNQTGLYLYPLSILNHSRGFPLLDNSAAFGCLLCGSAAPLYATPDGTASLGWKADGTTTTNFPGAAVLPFQNGAGGHGPAFTFFPTNVTDLNIQANVGTNGSYLFLAGGGGRVVQCQALDGAPGQTAFLTLNGLNGQPTGFSYKAPAAGVRAIPRLGLRNAGLNAVFEIGGLTLPAGGGVRLGFTPATNSVTLQNLSAVSLNPLLVYTSTEDPSNGVSLAFGPFPLPPGTNYTLTVAYQAPAPVLTIQTLDANNKPLTVAVVPGFDTRTRFTPGADCNQNGILDAVDIALGTSTDANGDGIPDECQSKNLPPPPVVGAPFIDANGHFALVAQGRQFGNYTVESSPDLRKWTPVLTTQAGADGKVLFSVPPPLQGARFFRVRNAQ